MHPLFGRSKVRRRILEAFFDQRGLESHVRETARLIEAGVSAVGRELDHLEGEGILESRTVGRNRVYRLSGSTVALAARDLFHKTRSFDRDHGGRMIHEMITEVASLEEGPRIERTARGGIVRGDDLGE